MTSDDGTGSSRGFELESHPGLLILVSGFFVAGAYALLDAFVFGGYAYASQPPLLPFLLVAVLAGLAALAAVRGAPRREAAVVGSMFVVAVTATTYPAMLRINAATDADGLQPYSYTLDENSVFRPPEPDLPTLRMSRPESYWSQLSAGDGFTFSLARGDLGFYQVHMGEVYKRIGLSLLLEELRKGAEESAPVVE